MDKSKFIRKKVVPGFLAFVGGMLTLRGYQKFFGVENVGSSGGFIEIPDEMYNISEKYTPNNSGLSNYSETQYSHEYHLKWAQNNCWVLSNLYFYFRPEFKSTYEKYASKSIKEIINDLDNLGKNIQCQSRYINYIFAKGQQNFLDDLKQNIKNSNFDNIFKYLNTQTTGIDECKKEIWDRIPNKNKVDSMVSYYNYLTLYRFHYAVSIKNRCRVYTKMLNNQNKMINIYEMDDLCKEGDSIPKWWFFGKGIYTKILKILGQKCKEIRYNDSFLQNLSSTLEYTNFYTESENGSGYHFGDFATYILQVMDLSPTQHP